MKIMKIKNNATGKKFENIKILELIAERLELELGSKGYITEYTVINSSRIDLKLRGRSFKVNTDKLGYNAKLDNSIKHGYRRSNTPTWGQRVDYNNTVNRVLNDYEVSCKVVSGDFTIRNGVVCFDERDWKDQVPYWMGKDLYIKEDEAISMIQYVNMQDIVMGEGVRRTVVGGRSGGGSGVSVDVDCELSVNQDKTESQIEAEIRRNEFYIVSNVDVDVDEDQFEDV